MSTYPNATSGFDPSIRNPFLHLPTNLLLELLAEYNDMARALGPRPFLPGTRRRQWFEAYETAEKRFHQVDYVLDQRVAAVDERDDFHQADDLPYCDCDCHI